LKECIGVEGPHKKRVFVKFLTAERPRFLALKMGHKNTAANTNCQACFSSAKNLCLKLAWRKVV